MSSDYDWGDVPGYDHDEPPPSSRTWRPVDLGDVLAGTYRPPEPTIGERDDGKGLLYPGRIHVVAAEAEAGKTWLGLAACATELNRGNSCVYLDFEDDVGGVVGRLVAMGLDKKIIYDRFAYIRPEEAMGAVGRVDLDEALGDLKPTLAILDGITEAMSLHDLELKDNTDVARFGQMLPRRIASSGAAVALLDHVVKNLEARNGYAIGGVHKLNGLNGAMYLLENKNPFGVGITGRSRLLIRKDRPAQLRRHGVQGKDGTFWYADLVVQSHDEDFTEVSLPPAEAHGNEPLRPTVLMAKIHAVLTAASGGLSGNAIEGAVHGRAKVVRYALELLISEGYVTVERRGSAKIHTATKPYIE